ncbi:hypothetical protein [Cerasicoccus arenae]|uniref:DUF4825 domain-containing protein n=1 Tax=Cerasicoccus arenae TaxID=424488 RepID=A0A8J3DAI5_9BACT|nr:hypothetical protein [Cerasicoccus arenae]MBK1859513.1 hypothetical protein [Cerasicoccus arenae]GHB97055.1 hypothetical protein GCM10007047_11300 [Cerasicoccus arenae]
MKSKWVIIALVVIAVIGGVIFFTRDKIDRGLSFPGKVGTAADYYFFNGTLSAEASELDITALVLLLPDGSQWKVVQGIEETSIPSWLICMIQGPERQTYVLEQSFNQTELEWLGYSFFNLALNQIESASPVKETPYPPDSPYQDIADAKGTADFEAALLKIGFRKMTR